MLLAHKLPGNVPGSAAMIKIGKSAEKRTRYQVPGPLSLTCALSSPPSRLTRLTFVCLCVCLCRCSVGAKMSGQNLLMTCEQTSAINKFKLRQKSHAIIIIYYVSNLLAFLPYTCLYIYTAGRVSGCVLRSNSKKFIRTLS